MADQAEDDIDEETLLGLGEGVDDDDDDEGDQPLDDNLLEDLVDDPLETNDTAITIDKVETSKNPATTLKCISEAISGNEPLSSGESANDLDWLNEVIHEGKDLTEQQDNDDDVQLTKAEFGPDLNVISEIDELLALTSGHQSFEELSKLITKVPLSKSPEVMPGLSAETPETKHASEEHSDTSLNMSTFSATLAAGSCVTSTPFQPKPPRRTQQTKTTHEDQNSEDKKASATSPVDADVNQLSKGLAYEHRTDLEGNVIHATFQQDDSDADKTITNSSKNTDADLKSQADTTTTVTYQNIPANSCKQDQYPPDHLETAATFNKPDCEQKNALQSDNEVADSPKSFVTIDSATGDETEQSKQEKHADLIADLLLAGEDGEDDDDLDILSMTSDDIDTLLFGDDEELEGDIQELAPVDSDVALDQRLKTSMHPSLVSAAADIGSTLGVKDRSKITDFSELDDAEDKKIDKAKLHTVSEVLKSLKTGKAVTSATVPVATKEEAPSKDEKKPADKDGNKAVTIDTRIIDETSDLPEKYTLIDNAVVRRVNERWGMTYVPSPEMDLSYSSYARKMRAGEVGFQDSVIPEIEKALRGKRKRQSEDDDIHDIDLKSKKRKINDPALRRHPDVRVDQVIADLDDQLVAEEHRIIEEFQHAELNLRQTQKMQIQAIEEWFDMKLLKEKRACYLQLGVEQTNRMLATISQRHQLRMKKLLAQLDQEAMQMAMQYDELINRIRREAESNKKKVSQLMDRFEQQFENLDVQTQVMDNTMAASSTLTAPQNQVDQLMQQAADEAGIELNMELPASQTATIGQATATSQATAEQDELTQRLARLRDM